MSDSSALAQNVWADVSKAPNADSDEVTHGASMTGEGNEVRNDVIDSEEAADTNVPAKKEKKKKKKPAAKVGNIAKVTSFSETLASLGLAETTFPWKLNATAKSGRRVVAIRSVSLVGWFGAGVT